MNYLLVDIGSTYTKLHLVNLEKRELLGSAKSYTTVETDVRIGYEKALKELKTQGNFPIDRILGCSSAAGGLKVCVIGFSKSLTTEAARLAALSSGARILKVYSYELSHGDLEEIQALNADMVVLCGGTEGGNETNILYNASKISNFGLKIPVVVAGNQKANPKIKEIFKASKMTAVFTENVMPATGFINYKPLRETIGHIFIENIAKAKGIEALSQNFDILLPTPIAVQRGISNFSEFVGEEVMSIDIGGATTDVLSIATAYKGEEHILSPLMEEPYEKRSVEGDMGMRYSAMAMYEAVGEELYLNLQGKNILENVKYRYEHPDFVPHDREDYEFDTVMAKIATITSMQRHIGYMDRKFTGTRYIYQQHGKDLRKVKYLLGTGGVLIHSDDPASILSMTKELGEDYLAPRDMEYYVDKKYLISSAGLIATVDRRASFELLKKYLQKC